MGLGPAVEVDCISKSTLRVAVANVMRDKIEGVFYWPSFEIVRWLAPHIAPAYGVDDGLLRHVNTGLIDLITDLFVEYYVASVRAERAVKSMRRLRDPRRRISSKLAEAALKHAETRAEQVLNLVRRQLLAAGDDLAAFRRHQTRGERNGAAARGHGQAVIAKTCDRTRPAAASRRCW